MTVANWSRSTCWRRASVAGAAACPALAGFPSGQPVDRPGRRYLNTIRSRASVPDARVAAIRGRITSFSQFPHRIDGPEVLHDVSFSVRTRFRSSAWSASRGPAKAPSQDDPRLYVPEAARADRWRRSRHGGSRLAAPQSGGVLQENVLFNRSIGRTSRSPIRGAHGAHHRGGGACRGADSFGIAEGTTTSSASAAAARGRPAPARCDRRPP